MNEDIDNSIEKGLAIQHSLIKMLETGTMRGEEKGRSPYGQSGCNGLEPIAD